MSNHLHISFIVWLHTSTAYSIFRSELDGCVSFILSLSLQKWVRRGICIDLLSHLLRSCSVIYPKYVPLIWVSRVRRRSVLSNWPFSSAITECVLSTVYTRTRSIFNVLRSDKSFVYQLASRTIYVIFIGNITQWNLKWWIFNLSSLTSNGHCTASNF